MNKRKIKLKVGDILSFELKLNKYGFARVLAKTKLGDAINVYNYFSTDTKDYKEAIKTNFLFEQPIILDSYSIFWKRSEGNWDLLQSDNDFKYNENEKIKFKYGVPGLFKLIDLNDKSYDNISQTEAEEYPDYSPFKDRSVKIKVDFLINNK